MSDYGELLDASTVRFERLVPGPIERVWSFLTEGDKRAKWLCSGDVANGVGGVVDMHFHNKSLSGDDDIPRPEKYQGRPEKISFTGTVTRFEPPYILEHTWEFGEGAKPRPFYKMQTQYESEYAERLRGRAFSHRCLTHTV